MRKVVVLIIAFAVVSTTVYVYFFLDRLAPLIELSSAELIYKFSMDDNSNKSNLSESNILLSGIVTKVKKSALIIDKKIFCKFKNSVSDVKVGDTIRLFGKFIGYDELFQEYKLNHCSIMNQ
ncbi:MAG: hypothetical protein CMP80_01910 [Formosa sp.]|nr:hypothetical protein [Formosa sp.]|tara:strand:- start:287 stop:652 length:366 start_codon:yes stop_codon:yes gene_type:complete